MQYFLGTMFAFAFNFAPREWTECEGQLLPISSNQALFSLLGTTYGGDGRTTFALPDLRGRAAIHAGQGPGISDRRLGSKGGTQVVTLSEAQLPSHTHVMHAETRPADGKNPQGSMLGISPDDIYTAPDPVNNRIAAAEAITTTGGGHSVANEAPYLALTWCICTQGLFPSRS